LGHANSPLKAGEKRRLGEVSPEWAWKREENKNLICYPLRIIIAGKDGTDRFNPLVGTSLHGLPTPLSVFVVKMEMALARSKDLDAQSLETLSRPPGEACGVG